MTLGTLLKQGREILQNAGIAEWDLTPGICWDM